MQNLHNSVSFDPQSIMAVSIVSAITRHVLAGSGSENDGRILLNSGRAIERAEDTRLSSLSVKL